MIMDLICKMYAEPGKAPAGLDIGTIQHTGEPVVIGPDGTETEFTIKSGDRRIVFSPDEFRVAGFLSEALAAWALLAEKEVTDMRARIAAKRG